MALTGQSTTGRGSSDVWDESLFGQAIEKAKSKTGTIQQVAGEALRLTEHSKFLPLVVSSKILLPLTGVFLALLITTGWQYDVPSKLASYLPVKDNLSQLAPGYDYLGAVGLALEDQVLTKTAIVPIKFNSLIISSLGQIWSWPNRANTLAATALVTGDNVASTFIKSLTSLADGIAQVYTSVQVSIIKIFYSINQSFGDLYDNLLSGVGFLSDQIELAVDSFFRPVKTSATSGWQESVATVSQVNEGLNKLLTDSSQALVSSANWLKTSATNWWQMVVSSWRQFINSFNASSNVQVDQEVKSDVKEIKQDVKTLLKAYNAQGVPTPTAQGMVVVPSTGSAQSDAAKKAQIANMFSDPVNVQLDETKQSGVITPTFTTGDSSNYLFLLAPIKQ